jgi:Flp pilus assembly protein TadG
MTASTRRLTPQLGGTAYPPHQYRAEVPDKGEEGSASLELAILTPVLLLIVLLTVAGGRFASARSQVREAARDAARAASLQRTPAAATTAAHTAAQAAFDRADLTCRHTGAVVDAVFGGAGIGGQVHVTVTCQVRLSDLSPLPLPGSTTVTADADSVLDTYRSQR